MRPAELGGRRAQRTVRRRRELAVAVGVALAGHAGLFTAILWRKAQVTADVPAVRVELIPLRPELRPPEPPREAAAPPKASLTTAPLRKVEPMAAPTVAPFAAAPQPRAPAPAPARPSMDTDALAKTVIPGKAIDCGWPGLSEAERRGCVQGRAAGAGEDDRFRLPPGKGERIPRFAMDRDKEVAFDATVDARIPEPPGKVTATSRCDGWASDNAQRNFGTGCFATSKPEGDGATRPKSKYVQPRGTPFRPKAR